VHHGAGLRALLVQSGRTDAEADAVIAAATRGGTDALAPAEQAMLAYARKLTVTPSEMTAGDVAALRAHGFDDLAIHDVCSIVAYFAFVNRIADGLGVELEERFAE
jgi:uncharacterized peroxidase-related enzyme